MNKNIELVVLLNGAFCPVSLKESQKADVNETMMNIVRKAESDPLAFVNFGDVTLMAKHIVGWYFRNPPENQTKEVLDLLKKNLPSSDGSDSWKSEE